MRPLSRGSGCDGANPRSCRRSPVAAVTPEAAALLGVSPLTIEKHLENIYATLGVSTRSAAVAHLLR